MSVAEFLFPRILPFVVLLANVGILMYILELEREHCECSKNWKRDFAKYVSIIFIVLGAFKIVFDISYPNLLLVKSLNLVAMAYSIIILVYFAQLYYSKCACSEDNKRYLLLYPAFLFPVAITVVAFFYVIMGEKDFKKFIISREGR